MMITLIAAGILLLVAFATAVGLSRDTERRRAEWRREALRRRRRAEQRRAAREQRLNI